MDLPKFFEELLVVVVLYKTKPEQSSAYTSIRTALNIFPASPEIFLYDNSPQPASINAINVTYFNDRDNSGVSKAYNDAAVLAGKKNKKWMLFFDQDTMVEPILFEKFSKAISSYPECVAFVPGTRDRKGLLSPFYFVAGKGRRTKTGTDTFPLRNFRFINTGLLVRHDAFVKAGGYDERIPLDFSDIAFGERLRKITDHFRAVDVALIHAFSSTDKLPLTEALARFQSFCKGAAVMGEITERSQLYSFRTFLRALNLCIHYRHSGFIKIFFQRGAHD